MGVTPYPYERWPRVSAREARAMRRAARALSPAAIDRAAALVRGIVGDRVELSLARVGRARTEVESSGGAPVLACVLARASDRKDEAVVVSIDPVLAAGVVDLALGGDGAGVGVAPGTTLTGVETGILAYSIERVIASFDRVGRSVVALLRTPETVDDLLGRAPRVAFELRARVGRLPEGLVRVLVPEALLTPVESPEETPRWIEGVKLLLVADVARGSLPRSDLERLEAGDVVVLDQTHADVVRGTILGASRTTLDLGRAPEGLRVSRIATASLETTPSRPTSMGGTMDTTEESTRVDGVTRAVDAPVEVAAELARFRLTVAELGALRVGDVLRTGAVVGEHVRLRVGEQIVAEGELVDVEGEVGVRVTRVAK